MGRGSVYIYCYIKITNKIPRLFILCSLSYDRKYVVFGELVQGDEVLKKIEDAGDDEGRPTVTVKIINCGEFGEGKKII